VHTFEDVYVDLRTSQEETLVFVLYNRKVSRLEDLQYAKDLKWVHEKIKPTI